MSIFNNETATEKSYLSGDTETLVNKLAVLVDGSKKEYRHAVDNFTPPSELARQKWAEHQEFEIGSRLRRNLRSLTTPEAITAALSKVNPRDLATKQLLRESLEMLKD